MPQIKILVKFVEKLLEILQYMVCNQERKWGNLIFWWGQYSTEGEKSNFWACRETPQLSPLVEHPDFPIRKNLIGVVGLLSVMILKRVGDTTFFQSERFTACKVKEEKEV